MSKLRGMRGILASSIGVTCAAALALPLAPPAAASDASDAPDVATRTVGTADVQAGSRVDARGDSRADVRAEVPGSTQSLPLRPLTHDRATGAVLGLTPRTVRTFSLLGVVWDDPSAHLHGRVQVRTRAVSTGSGPTGGTSRPTTPSTVRTRTPRRPPPGRRGAPPRRCGWGSRTGSRCGCCRNRIPVSRRTWTLSTRRRMRVCQARRGRGRVPVRGPVRCPPCRPGCGSIWSIRGGGVRGVRGVRGLRRGDGGAEPAEEPRTGVMTAAAKAASAANSALVPLGATQIPSLTAEETRRNSSPCAAAN